MCVAVPVLCKVCRITLLPADSAAAIITINTAVSELQREQTQIAGNRGAWAEAQSALETRRLALDASQSVIDKREALIDKREALNLVAVAYREGALGERELASRDALGETSKVQPPVYDSDIDRIAVGQTNTKNDRQFSNAQVGIHQRRVDTMFRIPG